jgi:hypothetical protein
MNNQVNTSVHLDKQKTEVKRIGFHFVCLEKKIYIQGKFHIIFSMDSTYNMI